MAQTIPTTEPASVTAGDTLAWTRSLPDFLASAGWVLKYRLINAAGNIDITSAASGDNHAITVSATTSAAYTAGTYTLSGYVESGDDRHTVINSTIIINPDLVVAATGQDTRTHAVKTLAAIEAVIEGRASQAHQEYTIRNRQMRFIPINELLELKQHYRREVYREAQQERARNGKPPRNKIRVRV